LTPVGKALWYIESHFHGEITLDDIAGIAGVSPCHLTRAFGDAMGYSLMRYVRGRRLTEAACALAGGAPDILAVALDARYGSHEAFTRAFREQFGLTPEALRERKRLDGIQLLEPIRMEESPLATPPVMRLEDGDVLLIAGLASRYACQTSAGIPSQWQRFLPLIGTVPGQRGNTAFGVRYNNDDEGNFDYLCGVAVSDFTKLSPPLTGVRVPARRYIVFWHGEHISTIRRTWSAIWSKWLPESGQALADAPDFECYGDNFDSRTGNGGVEIWVPIKS
jgi:AraC family transcriptional regulator